MMQIIQIGFWQDAPMAEINKKFNQRRKEDATTKHLDNRP